MSWEPATDFEDAIFESNNMKPTFSQFAQENDYGVATLRPPNRCANFIEHDDEEVDEGEINACAKAELQLTAYCRKLGNPFEIKPSRKWDGEDDGTSIETEITAIIRESGQEREPEDNRLDSKKTSKAAISVDKLPVAGMKNLFLSDDHFKFATPYTYGKSEPESKTDTAKSVEERKDGNSSAATVAIKEQESSESTANDVASDQPPYRPRRHRSPTLSVAGEGFYTPRQLYVMKARSNR